MPDITKCHGDNCPLKETCYRYISMPGKEWQSYFVNIPFKEGKCNHFMAIEKGPGHDTRASTYETKQDFFSENI